MNYSCSRIGDEKLLTGKILITKVKGDSILTTIYSGKDTSTFSVKRKGGSSQYDGFTWLNQEDYLIGTESIPSEDPNGHRCNIVKFDLKGKVIDVIYKAEKGELAWPGYSSKSDQYFLFTTHKILDYRKYPFEGLSPMLSLNIMDLKNKKVIKTVDSIGRSPNFHWNESPWLIDGKHFVYSISEIAKFKTEGSSVNSEKRKMGIYLYDLSTGEDKMIIPDASRAIASPVNNEIAYETKESICVRNFDTNIEKIIYQKNSNERIHNIHWTPDGQFIYIAYENRHDIELFNNYGEKLISIKKGEEVPFKKNGQGFLVSSWK